MLARNSRCGLAGLFLLSLELVSTGLTQQAPYAPAITPREFSKDITNPYFRMSVGRRLQYRERTEDGTETSEVWITGETRTIMGVETTVYLDRVLLDGQLIEETKDYLAQNTATGDVWYFGEAVDNYENGRFEDHHGSWIAGENGALPGVWFKGQPREGDAYRMEYLKGEAEDMARVVKTGIDVKVNGRTYKDCVQIYEWTPLDIDAREDKFYCRDVGAGVLVVDKKSGSRAELRSVTDPK
jgi:hypothetical protein